MSTLLRRLQQRDDAGFTLVELLVALVVISTALMALLAGFLTSAKAISADRQRTDATRVAVDRHETLRLTDYDSPALAEGSHPSSTTTPTGETFSLVTVIVERDLRLDEEVPGDLVKDLTTTVSWPGRDGSMKSLTYSTTIARDARTIGGPKGYVQAIRSMTVAPDPSVTVDHLGYATEDISVNVVMTGHDVSEKVRITWQDDRGARVVIAESTNARDWKATIPKGAAGIELKIAPKTSVEKVFKAETVSSSLTATSSLAVFGPFENAPVICDTCFTVTPSPLLVVKNGPSKYENKFDVTMTCTVDKLDVSATSKDSVRVKFNDADGNQVQQTMTRKSVSGTRATYEHVYIKSTYFFPLGVRDFTCEARRASDGGPATKTIKVTVST